LGSGQAIRCCFGVKKKKVKNFLIYDEFEFSRKLLIIGVKWEKLLSVGERTRGIKVRFRGVEKE